MTSSPNLSVEWIDHHREPSCPPNPAYPDGVDVDMSLGATRTCRVELPYPANRIGVYVVECSLCRFRVGVTTAGRVDDPRSLVIACALPDTPQ